MAVITSPKDEQYPLSREMHCSICEDRIYRVPFVVWWTQKGLFICADCCPGLMQGLAADLIQADAIQRINSLGYHSLTLHREPKDANDKRRQQERKKQEAEIWAAVKLEEI